MILLFNYRSLSLTSLIFLGILDFLPSSLHAVDFPGGLQYRIEDNTAIITDYTGTENSLVIPSSIEGYPVTTIGDWAFSRNINLNSIDLPDSVLTIGIEAFSYCRNLDRITLGSKLESIGNYAFYGCSSLTEITLPKSINTLGIYCLASCISLTQITLPDSLTKLPDGFLFKASSLTSVTLPSQLVSIGMDTFAQCESLISLELPASLSSIGENAFEGCSSLSQITLPEENQSYTSTEDALYNKEMTELILCSAEAYPTYTLPSTVLVIAENAFDGCRRLIGIEVEESNPSFSSYQGILFNKEGDTLLRFPPGLGEAYEIPTGTLKISERAFAYCERLRTILLPSSISYIGKNAFWYCKNLVSLGFLGNTPECGEKLFYQSGNPVIYAAEGTQGWESSLQSFPVCRDSRPQTISLEPALLELTCGNTFSFQPKGTTSLSLSLSIHDNEIASLQTNLLTALYSGETKVYAYQTGGRDNRLYYLPSISPASRLVILPAPLTITLPQIEISQGTPLPEPEYTVEGLLFDDTLTGDPIYLLNGIPAEDYPQPLPVGQYTLTLDGISPSAENRYTVQYIPGTLTIVGTEPEFYMEQIMGADGKPTSLIIHFTGILQNSTNGLSWQNIPNAEPPTYTVPILSGQSMMLYRNLIKE